MTGPTITPAEDGYLVACESHDLIRGTATVEHARNLFALHVRKDHDTDALTMPAHDYDGSPCKGSRVAGYVHLQHDGRWHCNACGTVTDPGQEAAPEVRSVNLSDAARFVLLVREGSELNESHHIAVLGVWEALTGLYGDDAIAYARECAARPQPTLAHVPTF